MLKQSKTRAYIVLFLAIMLALGPSASVFSQNSGANKIQDNELVVTTLGDSGEAAQVQILSHLRVFGDEATTIDDGSKYKLSSIRNLYSSDKIEQIDGKLRLKINAAPGKDYQDTYYLADLDKKELPNIKMPISVKVSYYLDGQKTDASKLAGKSGHLKIVCELENLTGVQKTLEFKNKKGETVKSDSMIYTPYVVSLSGWEFDNKKFSHIVAPGVASQSPQGVAVDVQGKTSVSWTVPMIPPSYPAKQYTTVEADAKNIELPAFKIAVIPILPTTAAVDTLGSVQDSLGQLYGAFEQIQGGVGTPNKDMTLLFGLVTIKDGMNQMKNGLGSLIDKLKQIRLGIATPGFDAGTYDSSTGADAKGNKPGVKDAISISKSAVDTKIIPALEGQKRAITALQNAIGKPGSEATVQPSLSTSLYNDVTVLKGLVKGTPGEDVINKAMTPKIIAINNNLGVLMNGGTMVTADGSVPFPASVTAVQQGMQQISTGLGKANSGLGMMVLGLGQVGPNGKPVKVLMNGQPGSILYALAYFQESIDGKVIPGVVKLIDGTSKIGAGSGQAKDAIAGGLNKLESAPAIISALQDNASQADSFLGKPDGAAGSVAYVFQTPKVSKAGTVMNYGLGAIALALIILFAIGRPPKQIAQFAAPEASKDI